MQAREFGAAAHTDTAARGNPGPGSFKSKRPMAVIATPDLDLWAQLGPMLESTVQPRHADSLASAATMLKPGTRTILLADLRGLSPDDFAPISGSMHNPVVIAIRDSASAGMVDQLMLEGSIHALVDSPVEQAAITRAVTDAARISSTADALSGLNATAAQSSGGEEEKSGSKTGLIVGIAVGVLALAGGGWFFMNKKSGETAPAAEAATPAAGAAPAANAQPAATMDEVLEKARLAMDERRYIEPAKNNALEYFRQVLLLDPANAEAKEGLKRLGGLLIARARNALDERRFDNALAELEAARSIDQNDPRLAEVDAKLDTMRAQTALAQIQATLAAQNFDRAQTLLDAAQKDALLPPAQIAQLSKDLDGKRKAATVGRLVASAEARLSSGRLVTPNDESAKDAIQGLKEAGASADLVARLNADLNQRLLAAARDAAAKGDQAAVTVNLNAARDNGVSAAALNAAQRDITAAAQKQQRTTDDIAKYAKAAQDRLASGQLLTPANDSAVSNAERLRLLDVRNPTTVQVVKDVRSRLVAEARSRVSAGKAADAAPFLDAAESLGGDADLGDLRAALASAQQAAATASAAPKLPPLKMTRPPKPKYPSSAKGVEGWVRVEFYVTPQGRTERIRVLQSEPAGIFDAAAVEAMSGARFEEFEATESRLAVQKISFKPE
ncbi:MAG TPA: energy transducer TonB [Steroidobacteraceae bacterium]|jgi:protein TonB|nr:energy transducer TonB [Steroidobacteraceae bacterium]